MTSQTEEENEGQTTTVNQIPSNLNLEGVYRRYRAERRLRPRSIASADDPFSLRLYDCLSHMILHVSSDPAGEQLQTVIPQGPFGGDFGVVGAHPTTTGPRNRTQTTAM